MAPDASWLGTLTPREREIAAAAATGAPIAQLAAELVVSPRTVETHLVRIYRKLGLRSRAELVALVLGHERRAPSPGGESEQEAAPAPSGAGGVRSSNLPRSASSFVGRQAEIDEVCSMVRQHRLVTVLGVGGAGKTRLALQVAEELFDGSGEGVWLVELGALTDAHAVPAAVATALGIAQQPGADVLRSLVLVLAELHLLVVLDNCEHLVGACAQLADAVLRSCPRVHILATSREALVVDGERLYRIPPLSLPSPDADGVAGLAGSEAALLFAERGAAQVTDFVVTDDDAALVGSICRRLDGLRWRSSWQPPGCGRCRRPRCTADSTGGSRCSPAAVGPPSRASRPLPRRSTGRTCCCRLPSRGCCDGCRSSPPPSISRQRSRSSRRLTRSRSRSRTCCGRWSTRASWSRTRLVAPSATGCSRPSATTRPGSPARTASTCSA